MQTIDDHLKAIAEQGFSIIKQVITPEQADAIAADLLRLEDDLGIKPYDNEFEGSKTVRIYNLLVHGKLYEEIPVHERVLPIIEGVLDEECLVSSLSSISIGPGETPQPLHGDDQVIGVRDADVPFICNTMWALSDFTEANGATRLVPGSHKDKTWPDYADQDAIETIAGEMNKGDVLVWNGSLWHGGGANQTDERRIGIAMNYCAGFIRQQENQQLGIPYETAKTFAPRLQELIGYGTCRNLIGHIDRKSPMSLFGEFEQKTAFELADE